MDSTTAASNVSVGNATEIDLCANTFVIDQVFTFFYMVPLFVIVILMSFFKVRKHLWPDCLGGRPGVLYPVNFIDEYERRWMYVAVLLLLMYRILFLFTGTYYIPIPLPSNVGFLKVFVTILNVVILCLQFYPMSACVVMRRSIIANILGILLTIPWLVIILFRYAICPPSEDKSADHHIVAEIVFEVPLFIALAVLIVGYSYDFYLNIQRFRRRRKLSGSQENNVTGIVGGTNVVEKEELCMVYIKALLNQKKKDDRPLTLREKIKEKFTFVRIIGFKYPPRVICTVALGLYALYKTAMSLTLEAYFLLDLVEEGLESLAPLVLTGNGTDKTFRLIGVYTSAAKWGFTVCAITSFVIHIFLMLHFLLQYRSHIRKFFAGDHSWHYKYTDSPSSVLVGGMRYSGYQIAFLIYGYIILTLVLFLLTIIIVGFIIIPLATKSRNAIANFLIDKIETLWPTVILGIAISFMQTLLAKFAFLQERGAYMALNNRRLYHVTSFFLFFFNVVLGLFSCLKRILLSMLFGTLLVSRLDRCILMRGFENFDSGFSAYLAMLTVDVYHNHPILKGFVHILQQSAKNRKNPGSVLTYNREGEVDSAMELSSKAKTRVRNKFWKMLTLMHNPSLVLERMKQTLAEGKHTENGIAQLTVDSMAGVESVIINKGAKESYSEKSEDFDKV